MLWLGWLEDICHLPCRYTKTCSLGTSRWDLTRTYLGRLQTRWLTASTKEKDWLWRKDDTEEVSHQPPLLFFLSLPPPVCLSLFVCLSLSPLFKTYSSQGEFIRHCLLMNENIFYQAQNWSETTLTTLTWFLFTSMDAMCIRVQNVFWEWECV